MTKLIRAFGRVARERNRLTAVIAADAMAKLHAERLSADEFERRVYVEVTERLPFNEPDEIREALACADEVESDI